MKLAYKIITAIILIVMSLSFYNLHVSATESSEAEVISEITSNLIDETFGSAEDAIQGMIIELDKAKIEITDEQKLKILEEVLKASGEEYDMEEVEKQLKELEQTLSDVAEALKIVKDILTQVLNVIKQIWESISSWFNGFKQTEEYDNIIDNIGNIKNTIEQSANSIENK